MEIEGDDHVKEELPSSTYSMLQHISGEAVRVAGEALQSVYLGSPKFPQLSGHRRCRSDVSASVNGGYKGGSFQRWKSQIHRALNWGGSPREQTFFNPEILADQKRQWYQFNSKSLEHAKYEEPSSLFEYFIVAGIHPDANLEAVEDAFARRKKSQCKGEKSEMTELMQHRAPSHAILEPQILFKYPPGKSLPMRVRDAASFCFPGGVKARVLEKTPSLSELNQVVYGQEHLRTDNSSFIFSLKVGDDATLYGVCLHVEEFVQRPPAIFGAATPLPQTSGGGSRFLVSAPRCYCLLTRVPFFELHYEMLNSIIAQERLNRITQFVSKVDREDHVPSEPKPNDQSNEDTGCSSQEGSEDWMDSAIPVDSAIELAAAAAGIISEDGLSSPPKSASVDISVPSQAKEVDEDEETYLDSFDHDNFDASEKRHDYFRRTYGSCNNVQDAEDRACACARSRTLEHLGGSESFCLVRRVGSEDEDDEMFPCSDKDPAVIIEWAKENRNDLLLMICNYHAMPLPLRGSEFSFKPLEHLQAIKYRRSPAFALQVSENQEIQESLNTDKVKRKLAAIEEAVSLSVWTTATICRVLSLENVLTLLAAVLLEKHVIITCPNLGVLSATVLSLIPMILPFEWQSLFLPVLPGNMLDFLDAPVPFVAGVQHKPPDFRMKPDDLVHVDVAKDQVTACAMPALPQHKDLIYRLGPFHARLAREKSAKSNPVYRCNKAQAEAAAQFLTITRHFLESLCSDLTSHTITSVQSNNDRVSLLLKDSFVDSFPSKEQPFIKQFVDTQMFTVLSDARLSRHENGYH